MGEFIADGDRGDFLRLGEGFGGQFLQEFLSFLYNHPIKTLQPSLSKKQMGLKVVWGNEMIFNYCRVLPREGVKKVVVALGVNPDILMRIL